MHIVYIKFAKYKGVVLRFWAPVSKKLLIQGSQDFSVFADTLELLCNLISIHMLALASAETNLH